MPAPYADLTRRRSRASGIVRVGQFGTASTASQRMLAGSPGCAVRNSHGIASGRTRCSPTRSLPKCIVDCDRTCQPHVIGRRMGGGIVHVEDGHGSARFRLPQC
jgi:hypothetical protein